MIMPNTAKNRRKNMVYVSTGEYYNGIFFSKDDIDNIKKMCPENKIEEYDSISDLESEFLAKKYYAVKNGIMKGIYFNWDDCKTQVIGFQNAIYKSFPKLSDALSFLEYKEKTDNEQRENITETENLPYAYVDGSYNDANRRYGYGVVLVNGTNKYELNGSDNDKDLVSMRNVAGEILGCKVAVKKAIEFGIKELVIYYDYQGIECWATGTWKRNKSGTIAYYEFMQEVKDKITIHFKKVKAHSGVELNEAVDRLAKSAVGIS